MSERDIEKKRIELDKKITGYVHPVETIAFNPSEKNSYQSYFESGDTPYGGTFSDSRYSVYSESSPDPYTSSQSQKNIYCPKCKKKGIKSEAVLSCNCRKGGLKCIYGHSWYIQKENIIEEPCC